MAYLPTFGWFCGEIYHTWMILLMAEILHRLACCVWESSGFSPYHPLKTKVVFTWRVVQDFSYSEIPMFHVLDHHNVKLEGVRGNNSLSKVVQSINRMYIWICFPTSFRETCKALFQLKRVLQTQNRIYIYMYIYETIHSCDTPRPSTFKLASQSFSRYISLHNSHQTEKIT